MFLLRSPSVIIPESIPFSSTKIATPKPDWVIQETTLLIVKSSFTIAISLFFLISCDTVNICKPRLPPGCKTLKSSGLKSRCSINATANASPKAIVSIVDVVGAIPMVHASGASVSSSLKSAACIKVLFLEEEITAVKNTEPSGVG